MDRAGALQRARELAGRYQWGPREFEQAASFGSSSQVQNYIELEGGGKETFSRVMASDLYSAYTWRVRHFREKETTESLMRFTPAGELWGFREKLPRRPARRHSFRRGGSKPGGNPAEGDPGNRAGALSVGRARPGGATRRANRSPAGLRAPAPGYRGSSLPAGFDGRAGTGSPRSSALSRCPSPSTGAIRKCALPTPPSGPLEAWPW